MTRKALVRIIVVTVIAIVLGGASLIIANNRANSVIDAPSAMFH